MNGKHKNSSSVTVKDVAARAGVALGTVSRYLNGYRLRDPLRERVEAAIADLGYKQNYLARGLKKRRTMTIAALIYAFTDQFSSTIISEIEHVVEQENYLVLVSDYGGDKDQLVSKLGTLRDRFIDGLVLFPLAPGPELTAALEPYRRDGIPVVVLNQDIPELGVDIVKVDNVSASFRAVEHLIHNGHDRIAVIVGLETDPVSRERLQGYLDAMATYHLAVDPALVVYGQYTTAGGQQRTRELFSVEPARRPTALYVTNYYMTFGALIALEELGLAIPADVSLVGFDHPELFDVVHPSLTVIEQPLPRIGQAAGEMLLQRLRGDYADHPRKQEISTRMLVRSSVRRLTADT